jgi:NAD(P)-dependent dehydrogenase (short-subunit alcohol dehydrogenase family)
MATSFVATLHLDPYPRLSPSKLRDEYQGKSVLITGGGYGIGASIARSFAEAGVATIILAGRTETSLKTTAAELTQSFPGLKVSYHLVDIASEVSVKSLFDSLTESPDVLVNNAGYLPKPENFVTGPLDEWWKGFQINVYGTALVTQSYLRHRAAESKQHTPAVVIALNTFAAFSLRLPNLSTYVASKIALARVFEVLSADVPESVARFISVNPGAVKTDMSKKSGLEGNTSIPVTDVRLSSEFIVWSASKEASFLSGRFAWANWDVDELVAKKNEVLENNLLISSFKEM